MWGVRRDASQRTVASMTMAGSTNTEPRTRSLEEQHVPAGVRLASSIRASSRPGTSPAASAIDLTNQPHAVRGAALVPRRASG